MRGTRSRRRLVPAECRRFPRNTRHRINGRAGGGFADAGQKQEDAIPADLVTRVLEYPQKSEHVLDVSCLEELQPAPLLERNLATGELDLEVRRHVTRAKKNRHLPERCALLVQLENPVDDE